jgi:hypothetical protein
LLSHLNKKKKNHLLFLLFSEVMFIYNTYDTLNQLIALYLTKFRNEILLAELTPTGADFVLRFGEALFTGFADLPMFRVRSLIRYPLRTCLTACTLDRAQLASKRPAVLELSQTLLEYFLPAILAKVNQMNESRANSKQADTDSGDQDEALNSQIIEENQFILLCRDVVDLMRALILVANHSPRDQAQDESASNEMNENDENGDMNENVNSKEPSSPMQPISELAVHLLKSSKIIYQSSLLCLLDGLNWSDSLSCSKLARVTLTLFETFQIVSGPRVNKPSADSAFVILLNEQIAAQIFKSCLAALQTHGEHQEIQGLLVGLAYSVYDRSPHELKQVYARVLLQIPGLNKKLFDDFVHKCNSQSGAGSVEKTKKDMFKRLLQPVVGKSLGQLYKSEVKIRVLEPLVLNSKRKMGDADANVEFNICSLFDPNY